MGTQTGDAPRKSEIRGSRLLRQVIHYTLGVAYLVGIEKKRKEARASSAVPSEGALESGNSSGVER